MREKNKQYNYYIIITLFLSVSQNNYRIRLRLRGIEVYKHEQAGYMLYCSNKTSSLMPFSTTIRFLLVALSVIIFIECVYFCVL